MAPKRSEHEVFYAMSILMSTLKSGRQSLIEFTSFPRLPAEIRLKIWRYSLKPRVVHLSWSSKQHRCVSTGGPSILQVSIEARDIGLEAYRPSFGTTASYPIYFNFDIDIACIRWETLGLAPERPSRMVGDCRMVKNLEIHVEDLKRHLQGHLQQGVELTEFENLEELHISGCRRSHPYNVEHLGMHEREADMRLKACLRSPVSKGRWLPPKLKCLGLGVNCRQHWWFKTWNELCTQKLLSWPFKYSNIDNLAAVILQDEQDHVDLLQYQTPEYLRERATMFKDCTDDTGRREGGPIM